MIYTTTGYDLNIGADGRVARILKELLYQIPEVQRGVPQINLNENLPSANSRFDTTAQTAVIFFQKWQNLKSRDGQVNYETWMALGKFASKQKIEFQALHDPILKMLLSGSTLSAGNSKTTLWPSQYGYLTHQNSVKRVLSKALSPEDLKQVVFAVGDADRAEWQTVEFSHRHAMTPNGTSQEDARKNANQFVGEELQLAQRLMSNKDSKNAMLHLGYAIHCLQDATSPAHAGFRVYEGGRLELANHVYEELFDPGPGSWLDVATLRGYQYFQNQLPCPNDYFADLGNDVYKKKK